MTQHEGKPEFVPVTAGAGTLTATLTHLSPLDFFKMDFSKFATGVGDSMRTLLTGESSKAPDCLEKQIDVDGVTLKANRTKNESGANIDAVWPCLRSDSGQIQLDLRANGNRAWLARSQPDVGTGVLSAPTSGDATAAGFFTLFYNIGKHRSTGTLMPGTTLTYTFSPDNPPARAEVQVDAGLLLTSALVYQITSILDITGASTYDNVEKIPGTYDCLLGAADTLDTSDKNFVDNFSSAFNTILGCLSAVTPGPLAFLLNIFNGGAGLVSGLLTAAWNEITGNNHGIVTIDSSGRPKSDYALTWTGHTRQMHLNADGTGDVTIFSGAADGETWSATWDTTATGVTVSLVSLTSKTGAGLGDLKPGTKWVAALQKSPDDNKTVLHFVDPGKDLRNPNEGFYWCAEKYGYSYDCGA
ncbi:hypothetical protein ACQPW1_22080 [Nocardia sp. CA-128927]|uniref:hypothetical protein n=1 Tax=Nocardia sp. CA-128927 TaxID=3239975 RepID=UPI003D983B81